MEWVIRNWPTHGQMDLDRREAGGEMVLFCIPPRFFVLCLSRRKGKEMEWEISATKIFPMGWAC